jgi:hypothetical protein
MNDMKYSKTDYPIGAAWEGRTRNGKIVCIWLAVRSDLFETWRWSAYYEDGSGHTFDWDTSYRNCVNNTPVIKGKYKRIKN